MRTTQLQGLLVACVAVGAGCAGRNDAWAPRESEPAATASSARPTGDGDATALVAKGDAHWGNRSDAKDAHLALETWAEAAAQSGNDPDLLVKLTRGHYFFAEAFLRDDEDAYVAAMDQAVVWGQKALLAVSPAFRKQMDAGAEFSEAVESVDKAGVPALYWYASALGRWARAQGFGGVMGNKDDVKATMDRCLQLEPEYFYGGPHRYFGAYYAIAPGIVGGDPEKSKVHFQKSLEIAPDYLGTKVLWAAELAVKERDEDTFEKLLNEVLTARVDALPELAPEARIEQAKARELLAAKDDLF